jgi:hypothetical protein
MISQRRIAQLGLLAATAVFVLSVGIIMSSGGDRSQPKDAAVQSPVQTGASESHPSQNVPITLSASADSGTVASR